MPSFIPSTTKLQRTSSLRILYDQWQFFSTIPFSVKHIVTWIFQFLGPASTCLQARIIMILCDYKLYGSNFFPGQVPNSLRLSSGERVNNYNSANCNIGISWKNKEEKLTKAFWKLFWLMLLLVTLTDYACSPEIYIVMKDKSYWHI